MVLRGAAGLLAATAAEPAGRLAATGWPGRPDVAGAAGRRDRLRRSAALRQHRPAVPAGARAAPAGRVTAAVRRPPRRRPARASRPAAPASVAPAPAAQRPAQQLVGERRALGQHRAVQVGAEDVVADRALGQVGAVVAAAGHGLPERVDAGAELGQAAVVLEADQPAPAGCRRGCCRSAGCPSRWWSRPARPTPAIRVAVLGEEVVPEHLVRAADGQHHHAVVGHRAQRRGRG